MAETSIGNRPRWRRRQYLIDSPLQMGVAGHVLAGLGGVALLCGAVLYVILGRGSVPGLEPLQKLLLLANATYFILSAAILTVLVVLITHRFAGPSYVMRQAIQGMLEGDYARRLSLRETDYLKPLANELGSLRDAWIDYDETTRERLLALENLLAEDGPREAVRLVAELKAALQVKKSPASRPEAVEVAAETPQPEPKPEAARRVSEPTLVG